MANELFQEFPSQSKEEWIEQVEKELKSRAYGELEHEWLNDLKMEPFYHPDDNLPGLQPIGKASGVTTWSIAAQVEVNASDDWEDFIQDAIEGGVHTIYLTLAEELPDSLPVRIEEILSRELRLHCSCPSPSQAGYLADSIPWGGHSFSLSVENDIRSTLEQWNLLSSEDTISPYFTVLSDQGADAADQLKQMLERWMMQYNGLPENRREEFVHSSRFVLTSGSNYLLEIAKIRSFKILWINLMNEMGSSVTYPHITARVPRTLAGDDPQINHIKSTVSAMAGLLGGADELLVESIHGTGDSPSRFSHRMARNILHILKLESAFDTVADPVAGSFYIDHLTRKLTERVWDNI